ncbi:hypothetical protein [Persicobacter psychrovividus]|uniref:Transposase n=1 Tax=Persicobacter psychrovividus TaxID=387638 RepID=A0ABN6LFA1_9BACT|nr:hypothetical protein PEPS_23990 [Persicobacter psychrovividus]
MEDIINKILKSHRSRRKSIAVIHRYLRMKYKIQIDHKLLKARLDALNTSFA